MRFWNAWFGSKRRSRSSSSDSLENLVSLLNQLSARMQDVFDAHMKRAQSNVVDVSASEILDNVSVAFYRSGAIAGTILGNVLRGLSQDVANIVFYDDLKLRFSITITKSVIGWSLRDYFAQYTGYMSWLRTTVMGVDPAVSREKDIPIFAHLIFVINNDYRVDAHLCIVPNGPKNNSPLTVLPADLLTEQERSQFIQ
jgi:hypothetical protein